VVGGALIPDDQYVRRAEVVSVHDGDTLHVNIDHGMHLWTHDVPVRLAGSNAPELVIDKAVSATGEASTLALLDRLGGRSGFAPKRTRSYFGVPGDYVAYHPLPIIIQTRLVSSSDWEKYGRVLANVWVPSVGPDEVSAWLVANGYAVAYLP
jgi:endonuclease YncB( thermonuclease family)